MSPLPSRRQIPRPPYFHYTTRVNELALLLGFPAHSQGRQWTGCRYVIPNLRPHTSGNALSDTQGRRWLRKNTKGLQKNKLKVTNFKGQREN